MVSWAGIIARFGIRVGTYPLDRRLGGPQSRSGLYWDKKNPLPLPGIEPRTSFAIPTELSPRPM
jgi:hypothetical protein